MDEKKLWNSLAYKNYKHYIFTGYGRGITDEQFEQSGRDDYQRLIKEDELIDKMFHKLRETLRETSILEIGCGAGRLLKPIAENYRWVYGADISEEMIKIAKLRLFDYKNVYLAVTNGKTLPWIDNTFNLVFSYAVFQHVKSYDVVEQNFSEAYRVLKRGGIFKVLLGCTKHINMETWYSGVCFTDELISSMLDKLKYKELRRAYTQDRRVWLWLEKP